MDARAPEALRSYGTIRVSGVGETGRVTSIISTGDIARDEAVIDPNGWDFTNYDRNPVVLWGHDDSSMPVARTVAHRLDGSELVADAEIDMDDAAGRNLARKIAKGFVNATSVRWLPKRWEYRKLGARQKETLVFLEQELLEWSFVSVPADPKAVVVRSLRVPGKPEVDEPLDIAAFIARTSRPATPRPVQIIAELRTLEREAPARWLLPYSREWGLMDELAVIDRTAFDGLLREFARRKVRA